MEEERKEEDLMQFADEDGEFENICHNGGTDEENKFDEFVGCLQDIVLNETFQEMQDSFCNKNCVHFDNTDENKLIYMTIFNKWQSSVE